MYLPEKLVTSVSTESKQREVGYLGKQVFELSNHLGNILATITDKKLQVSLNTTSTAYFEADVQTVQDYYAFGMQMPGRIFNSSLYRYGAANGQEKSKEINENSYTAEYWQYDARIIRRWNVDPVVKDDESPYMTYGNNPIVMVDPSGADWYKNEKSGGIEYKAKWEGESKNSKYKYVGKGEGDILKYEGKEYNKKTGSVTNILDEVVVESSKGSKKKAENNSGANIYNWPSYSKADGERWDRYHAMVRDRHRAGQDLLQIGDPLEYTIGINSFERAWQAEQSWRSVNYAILDGATFFVPVPKLGMGRWLFGSRYGRVFWTGGGASGIAAKAAREYAAANFGTTLAGTNAGKIIIKLTGNTQNWLTGKIWDVASWSYARGAKGSVDVFIHLSPTSSPWQVYWRIEKPVLEKVGVDIIEHYR
jgi:hypothetical protein